MNNRLLLIDGNSILNRAFYGIMGSKMLMTADGTYTNAVYGFLGIMFKNLEELAPKYMAITFDLKAKTMRHKLYDGYKANRKGMPNELAEQMPIIKEILRAMNIAIVEKEGYEGDDILGTLAKFGEKNNIDVTILSGDRDNFQLITDKITVRIPRTKSGKTEVDDFNKEKILETYEIEPKDLIQVKGLMGDTSDNIPGVPGVGEKTALNLVKEYKTIDNLYECLENGTANVKGKLKEKLENNKELAFLSRTLGTINQDVPIEKDLDKYIVKDWNKKEVLELFKKLKFNRYIDRFNLREQESDNEEQEINENKEIYNTKIIDFNNDESIKELEKLIKIIEKNNKIIYFLEISEDIKNKKQDKIYIINKEIVSISIVYNNDIYYIDIINNMDMFTKYFKKIFENKNIDKVSYKQKLEYILFRQLGINSVGYKFDLEIAAYLLNPTASKYLISELSMDYIDFDIQGYLDNKENDKDENINQINLFDSLGMEDKSKSEKHKERVILEDTLNAYCINKLSECLIKKLEETNQLDLFNNIEMPLVEVLADMQYTGMKVDKNNLIEFGTTLKNGISELTKEIYKIVGEEFNINSTKQLGEILFDKLQLPIIKKTKSGYSTDVEVLEKLKNEHPVIEKILEYRQLVKLNSTYVEGMIPYINEKTHRIHSYFHQTVTATGRISSTEPNLQNIPTKIELGKQLRKVFIPNDNSIYIDADYSQIELRVLAHISGDENMIEAFNNGEDIHAQAASKVFDIPLEEVTKEKRSQAKAVNFGIVYGISDFGLAEQLNISRKQAKIYIDQYLEKYSGIKNFMTNIIEQAKKDGYVETLYHRRRYIPEISSNNYMVRQFGNRVAMNTPIQGTAADIMKIAMISTYNKLKENKLKTKIVLQIHDELILEAPDNEKEIAKKILKESMENAIKLKVPLIAELGEAKTWYDSK